MIENVKKKAYGPHIGPKHWILKLSKQLRTWLLRRVCSWSSLPSSCSISIFSETNTDRLPARADIQRIESFFLQYPRSVLLSIIAKCQVLVEVTGDMKKSCCWSCGYSKEISFRYPWTKKICNAVEINHYFCVIGFGVCYFYMLLC